VRVELGVISEDLRQRVLTAIASELERDEAERRRNAQVQDGAGARASYGVPGTEQAIRTGDAADGNGVSPANGGGAGTENIGGVSPVNGNSASAEGADASLATSHEVSAANGSSTKPGNSLDDRAGATPADDAVGGSDGAAAWPAVPLPRRAPGANGAPPPPAPLRREYLPSSLPGRRLEPEAHTEPLPRVPGTGPGGPAASGSGQSTSVFSPRRPAAASLATPSPAGSPAEPGPPASGSPTAAPPGAPAEPVPPEAPPAEEVPPGTAPPDSAPPPSAPSASAIAAASAPTMPVGSAALAAASAPTMPVGTAALAAGSVFTPSAEPARTAPGQAPVPTPAPSLPAPSRSPAASPPAGYGWVADPGGTRPGSGRGTGAAVPLPAALPTAKRPGRSGRPYRIAGVILAVVALVVAGVIALLLSGRTTPRHGTGLGPPSGGTGAVARTRAAAWVAGQVSPTAMVACDPVMCQALRAHGVAAGRLYQLGPQTTSPLRSQIIVATAVVRAQFGNVLSSVYAPAVLASFGLGPDRIDIRPTAQHGAAAYRALLSADLANRKVSGTQLLHSGRITAAPIARRQLAAGHVDGRLLSAIAQMAATHPMFIVDFGIPAPGAGPGMPLRQADLAEDGHAYQHAGHVVRAGYVRSMVAFLHAQHGPFRPARVQTVHLAGGLAVLRIEFTAPSPLGLLGPHA
jgi:hypothetical protein